MCKDQEFLEPICINCNEFFLIFQDNEADYGICLNDEVFEPYLEEILMEEFSCCQDIIDEKSFDGCQDVCNDYNPVEFVEDFLDEEEVEDLNLEDLNPEELEELLLRKIIAKSTIPVQSSQERLKSSHPLEREQAIQTLGGLHGFGNKAAMGALISHLKELPVVETIEDVHDRLKILEQMQRVWNEDLLSFLQAELYRTPSNNTTRQWIGAIFDYLEDCPLSQAEEALEAITVDTKNFSHRLRKKAREKLERRSRWGVM